MKSILHKTHRRNRYATVNLTCLEDDRLSGLAKAIHFYAMSRPDDWDLNTADIIQRFQEGRDAIYKALGDLKGFGYLTQMQERIGQRFGPVELHWYEVPQLPESQDTETQDTENQEAEELSVDSQHPESPDTESPHPENPHHSRDRIPRDHGTKEPQGTTTPPASVEPAVSPNASPETSKTGQPESSLAKAMVDEPGCAWCRNPKIQTSGVQFLLQKYHDKYVEHIGYCPTILPPRDGGLLGRLLKAGRTDPEITATMDRFFTDQDGYFVDTGYSVRAFVGAFDGLRMRREGKRVRGGGDDDIRNFDEFRKP